MTYDYISVISHDFSQLMSQRIKKPAHAGFFVLPYETFSAETSFGIEVPFVVFVPVSVYSGLIVNPRSCFVVFPVYTGFTGLSRLSYFNVNCGWFC